MLISCFMSSSLHNMYMVSSETINSALKEYLNTTPDVARLDIYIKNNRLESQREVIVEELNSAVKSTEDYIYDWVEANPIGILWTEGFRSQYIQHLLSKHFWLDEDSLARLLSFSSWLCWHEGFNAGGLK
jgi:hypothetical protein